PLEEAEKALLAKWLPAYYAQEEDIPTLTRLHIPIQIDPLFRFKLTHHSGETDPPYVRVAH
ncbi:MAG: hypothetical protein AAFQ08_00880, partial [Bacteroidota bacterium]